MAMMGASGGRKSPSAADDLIALARVVSNDDTYRARVAELERMKAEADAARDESLKAAQAADQERQAQLAAANHNAARLEEARQEQAKLSEAVQAFMADKAKVKAELEAWSAQVQAESERVTALGNAIAGEKADFERDRTAFRVDMMTEKANAEHAQKLLEEKEAAVDALKAQYEKKLAGAAALLAQETGEGR